MNSQPIQRIMTMKYCCKHSFVGHQRQLMSFTSKNHTQILEPPVATVWGIRNLATIFHNCHKYNMEKHADYEIKSREISTKCATRLSSTKLFKSAHESTNTSTNFSMSSRGESETVEHMNTDEKAAKFQRPKAQTTIDEQEISHFSALSSLWWDEGGEFEALHSLNELRIPLIRDAMMSQKTLDQYKEDKPLEGFWIMDVGSGGGILTEPLARLGASVIGVEASEENIKIAQAHLMHDPEIRDNIKYVTSTVEDLVEEQAGKFDAVIASEVLEHVADANTFVSSACQLVRPGGSIFLTTLNKTRISYVLGIVVAEQMLRLVSPGTHDWNKFISPIDLQYILEKNHFITRLVHGMWYNPLSKRWSWAKDTSINYAVHAVKSEEAPGQENVWSQTGETKTEPVTDLS